MNLYKYIAYSRKIIEKDKISKRYYGVVNVSVYSKNTDEALKKVKTLVKKRGYVLTDMIEIIK